VTHELLKQRFDSSGRNEPFERAFPLESASELQESKLRQETSSSPCGGGVEYLHSDPASRRRRRKGKSQIRDSKVASPKGLGPGKDCAGKGQQHI
jgi:hypothetical protein